VRVCVCACVRVYARACLRAHYILHLSSSCRRRIETHSC